MVTKNKTTKASENKTTTTKTAKTTKKLSKKAENSLAPTELWARLNNTDLTERKYSIAENYNLNDKIIHPAFGVGFVRQILEFHRLEVLFEDKSRVLVQNK